MTEKPSCPVEATLDVIGGRWKVMILYWLMQGARRFNQLQRELGPITHRTLARQLREMERDDLLVRTDHGSIPPRVEYSLTARGLSLKPVLMAMQDWALQQGDAQSLGT